MGNILTKYSLKFSKYSKKFSKILKISKLFIQKQNSTQVVPQVVIRKQNYENKIIHYIP